MKGKVVLSLFVVSKDVSVFQQKCKEKRKAALTYSLWRIKDKMHLRSYSYIPLYIKNYSDWALHFFGETSHE